MVLIFGVDLLHFILMAATQVCLVISLIVVISLSRTFTTASLKSFGITFLLVSLLFLNLGHFAHFAMYLPKEVYGGAASTTGHTSYVYAGSGVQAATIMGLPTGLFWVYLFHVFVLASAVFITLAAFRLKKLGDEFGLKR